MNPLAGDGNRARKEQRLEFHNISNIRYQKPSRIPLTRKQRSITPKYVSPSLTSKQRNLKLMKIITTRNHIATRLLPTLTSRETLYTPNQSQRLYFASSASLNLHLAWSAPLRRRMSDMETSFASNERITALIRNNKVYRDNKERSHLAESLQDPWSKNTYICIVGQHNQLGRPQSYGCHDRFNDLIPQSVIPTAELNHVQGNRRDLRLEGEASLHIPSSGTYASITQIQEQHSPFPNPTETFIPSSAYTIRT